MVYHLRTSLCVGFSVLALGIACAQQEKVLFENVEKGGMRVFISKETGMVTTRLTKVNYHDVRLFNPDHRIVAKDTIVTEYADASEGETSRAKVEFFHAAGDPNSADFVLPKSPTQTMEIKDVSQVKYQDDHWSATTFGCCDAEPYTRLYAYGASTPFLRFNSGYAKAEVPNAAHVNRYVGVVMRGQVPNDSALAAIFGKNTSAVAAITYASAGKTLQHLLLKPKDGVKDIDVPYHTMGVKLLSKSPKDVPGWQE